MLIGYIGVVLTREAQLAIAWWRLNHVLNLSGDERRKLLLTVERLAKEKYSKRRS